MRTVDARDRSREGIEQAGDQSESARQRWKEPPECLQVSALERCADFLQSAVFESALSALLVANVFFMALEMQFLGHRDSIS